MRTILTVLLTSLVWSVVILAFFEPRAKSEETTPPATTTVEPTVAPTTSRAEKKAEKPTKEAFTKERVTIMKYNKMQIDPKVITAGEYAWLVRQTCDEIEELNRKHKK